MSIQINIEGVDKSNQIDWSSINVQQILTKQSDEMVFRIKNYGTKSYQPAIGDEVIFTNGSTRVFAGNIIQINYDIQALAGEIEVVVKDYSNQLDSQLVAKNYVDTSVEDIVNDIITSFTDGTFTTVNVVCPTIIPAVSFGYISVSECFKKLVSLLVNFDWYVDYDKDIHFIAQGTVLSPFNLSDTGGKYIFNSLSITSDISQLANDITIQSGQVGDNNVRTEYFTGDGTRTIFPLATNFNAVPDVTVASVAKTVGIDAQDADASFDAMWDQNSQRLRFTAGHTPAAGTNNIVVTGISRFPLIYRKQDQLSISLYGLKQKYLIDKTIQDARTASLRVTAELGKYSYPTMNGAFTTYESGLVVGQLIHVNSVIRGIDTDFKIQSIRTSLRTPNDLVYEITIETNNSLGINDVLSKLLIQDPANGVDITQNATIERVFIFPEPLSMIDEVTDPTFTTGPYVYDTAKWNLATWA